MQQTFSFIRKKFLGLVTLNYILALALLLSLAWLFNTPALNHAGYKQSSVVVKSYNYMLNYFITILMMLHVGSDFREEIKSGRINSIRMKYHDIETISLYVVLYILFFFFINIVPAYFTALIQQYFNSPRTINYSVFIVSSISSLLGYGIIWVLFTLYLIYNNVGDSKIIIIFYSFAFLSLSANKFIRLDILNPEWLFITFVYGFNHLRYLCIIIWLLLFAVVTFLLYKTAINMSEKSFQNSYNKGFYAKMLEIIKNDLAGYHVKMLGVEKQKILFLLTMVATAVIYSLLKSKSGDFTLIAKIYLGAIFPVLFSFNQQQIIEIDHEAGTFTILLLRKAAYWKIILSRWFVIVFPQIIILSVYFIILFYGSGLFNLLFFSYLLSLNIFGSLLNLYFQLIIGKGSAANIMVLIFFYLPMRSDIQALLVKNRLLNNFNVYESLTQIGYVSPSINQQIILSVFIALLLSMTVLTLKRKNNAIDY